MAARCAADSPAISGISGLGHITLTAAFLLLFMAIGARVRAGRGTIEERQEAVRA